MTAASMSSTEWLIEILLTVLLTATLVFAFRLQRALTVLRHDRTALEEMIGRFTDSSKLAETSIERLRSTADVTARQVGQQVEQATSLHADLQFLVAHAERLADQLEVKVRQAKPRPVAQPPVSRATDTPGFPNASRLPDDADDEAVSSQAEKELLKALRLAR